MATVDDAARAALSAVDSDADFLHVVDWASDRYRELTTRNRFRSLRVIGELSLPATTSTGTVTATRSSTVVTASVTAQAAWLPLDLAGRFIRINRIWYRIASKVVSGTTVELRLESPFAEATQTAVAYKIVQRFSRLDPRARHLGSFVWMRFGYKLDSLPLLEADITYPDRLLVTAGGPQFVTEVGVDADGVRMVEIYPYATNNELIHYVFYPHSPRLRPGDSLPEAIDPYVLREGVLIDIYRYEMSKALRAGRVEQSAVWSNNARAQVQTWEQAIKDAGQADTGQDDVSFIIRSGSFQTDLRPFINSTAYTDIYLRGNRP